MGTKENKEFDLSDVIGGAFNIFGLKIDLGKLLSSPEEVKGHLEQLREKLKQTGGKETLTDEEWRGSHFTVSGSIKTRGILGEREYHVGTGVRPGGQRRPPKAPEPPEVVEPPVDVFVEPQEVIVVAEVPGVELSDLEVTIRGNKFLSLATTPAARRGYRKDIALNVEVDPDTIQTTCRNGILEVRLQRLVGERA